MKINKINSFIIIIPFIAIISFFAFYSLFDKDSTVSQYEGRKLSSTPDFSVRAFFSGDYMRELDSYFSDTFPKRDAFLKLNKKLNYFYSLPIIKSEFYFTPDNHMILYGNAGMELFSYNEEAAYSFAAMVNSFRASLSEEIKISLVLVPTTSEFNRPKALDDAKYNQKAAIDIVYSEVMESGVNAVDAYNVMKLHKGEFIYFRTDHHWTALGAYYVYKEFAGEKEAVSFDKMTPYTLDGFLGSMYKFTSQIPQNTILEKNPDTIHYYGQPYKTTAYYYDNMEMQNPAEMKLITPPEEASMDFKYTVFLQGDHPLTAITSEVSNGKSILIVKDSYANAFIPYLTNNYEKIYVIDPRFLGGEGQNPMSIIKFVTDNSIGELMFLNYSMSLGNRDWETLITRIK